MQTKLPIVFVTHGSPMLAIEPAETGPLLTQLGQRLQHLDIKGIIIISAHWITRDVPMITAGEQLSTIHDFGGFPRQLYQLQYPAKGSPTIAKYLQNELKQFNITAGLDEERGLDHGAWIPLQYIFPQADIPVIQLSIPWPMNAAQAIIFGNHLKDLRNKGMLLIMSGSLTHNLHDVGYDDSHHARYIKPFVNWVDDTIKNHDLTAMANYRELAPYAKQAHPTDEHFLPLIIAQAASDIDDEVTVLDGDINYQALAMKHYIFGQY